MPSTLSRRASSLPVLTVALVALAAALPLAVAAAELVGGTLRLQPAPPMAAVEAEAPGLRLTALLGQPLAGRSDADGQALHSGFHTPEGALPGDALFADGFEETTP